MTKVLITFALLAVCFCTTATAKGSPEEVVIGHTETVFSKTLNEKRQIMVSLPEGYEESGYSYPVLYFTDANVHFEIMSSTVNFLQRSNVIPPMILVGIVNGPNRTRDLTPNVFSEKDLAHPWFQTVEFGGARNFLTFVEQELIPHIDKKYRTSEFKVLSGHSFGGLFSFYAYVNKPNLFDGIMAISPSLAWDEERIIKEAKQMIEDESLPKKSLYISKGNEKGTTVSSYQSITKLFEDNASYPMTSQEFPNESHLTVVFDAQYHGLKTIFKDWELAYMESAKGLDVVKLHNKKVKETYKIDFTSESWLINLGNSQYYKKNYDAAIEAYEYNISLFPKDAYSYFQLGKTYEAMDEQKLAQANYVKANYLVPATHRFKSIYEAAVQKTNGAD